MGNWQVNFGAIGSDVQKFLNQPFTSFTPYTIFLIVVLVAISGAAWGKVLHHLKGIDL
jgi:hypothetical protein